VSGGRDYARPVRAYALADLGDRLAVDVYLRREDAYAELEEILRDEPEWAGLLYVAPIELDERDVSSN
jgi:hypothetical protein